MCPTASGSASVGIVAEGGATPYSLRDVTLMAADVGRYLQVSGANLTPNNGAFAILAVGEGGCVCCKPAGERRNIRSKVLDRRCDLYSPFESDAKVSVALQLGEEEDFDAFEVEIEPG